MNSAATGLEGSEPRALLKRMYPPPHRLDAKSASTQRVQYIAAPSATAPRVIADARSTALVTRVLGGQARAARLHKRLARAVMSGIARAGLHSLIPGTSLYVHGEVDAPSIEDPLRAVLGVHDVLLAMSFGPQRANRKPVIQVVAEGGQVLAFAKVGHNDLTQALVRREAECLTQLSALTWSNVEIPEMLGLISWEDLIILIQSPLTMPQQRAEGEQARLRLLSVVDEISGALGRSSISWASSPLRARLFERLTAAGRVGEPWLARLRELPDDRMLSAGGWHGDLNPGNMALTRERCPVWDWERFETGVPLGLDLLHHDLQRAVNRQRQEPAAAAADLLQAAPQLLARWGHDPAQADLACRAYLIALADRYLADDQEGAGARLGAVQSWLLPVLGGRS